MSARHEIITVREISRRLGISYSATFARAKKGIFGPRHFDLGYDWKFIERKIDEANAKLEIECFPEQSITMRDLIARNL